MSEVQIRRAQQADLPAVVAMLADDELGRARENAGVPLAQAYLDAFAADQVMGMKKAGRPDKAEVFESGYRKAKLKGACTGLIEFLKNKSSTEYISPYEIAVQYALIDDRDHTFQWLEKAYAEHSGRMEYVKMEDFFQPFRSDPRYLDLLRRMGMSQ